MYTNMHINKNDKLKINYFTQNQQNLRLSLIQRAIAETYREKNRSD